MRIDLRRWIAMRNELTIWLFLLLYLLNHGLQRERNQNLLNDLIYRIWPLHFPQYQISQNIHKDVLEIQYLLVNSPINHNDVPIFVSGFKPPTNTLRVLKDTTMNLCLLQSISHLLDWIIGRIVYSTIILSTLLLLLHSWSTIVIISIVRSISILLLGW